MFTGTYSFNQVLNYAPGAFLANGAVTQGCTAASGGGFTVQSRVFPGFPGLPFQAQEIVVKTR